MINDNLRVAAPFPGQRKNVFPSSKGVGAATRRLINDRLINQSLTVMRLLLRGLIQDGFFTSWKLGFVFDPRLPDLQLLVLEVFHFAF